MRGTLAHAPTFVNKGVAHSPAEAWAGETGGARHGTGVARSHAAHAHPFCELLRRLPRQPRDLQGGGEETNENLNS
eukprot:1193595-Prorocentrum_minimum.AAC.3